jgi:hypothetical protein
VRIEAPLRARGYAAALSARIEVVSIAASRRCQIRFESAWESEGHSHHRCGIAQESSAVSNPREQIGAKNDA